MNLRSTIHNILFNACVALCLATLANFSFAGPGHDHGDEAQKTQGAASPRFEAHSDLFELVGVYEKGAITLYLDRYATNEPLTNAKIEYDAAGAKGIAAASADGTYRIESDALTAAKGTVAFAFTITHGNDADLLAAELAFPSANAANEPHSHTHVPTWAYLLLATLSVATAFFIVLFAKRRKLLFAPIKMPL